jgi:uncharacterized membrane protein YcaP (DUF421 family)
VVILGFDIGAALIPDVSLFEIVVRGIVVYFTIFTLLRVVLRGRTSAVAMSDLLVIVLIADAAQNAMAAEYHTITDGLVLVATIVLCSFTVDWVAYRSETVRKFVHPPRQPLVVNGRLMRKILQEELITEDELFTQLRLNGIEEIEDVKAAYLEGNGEVSVIKREAPRAEDDGKQSRATATAN